MRGSDFHTYSKDERWGRYVPTAMAMNSRDESVDAPKLASKMEAMV